MHCWILTSTILSIGILSSQCTAVGQDRDSHVDNTSHQQTGKDDAVKTAQELSTPGATTTSNTDSDPPNLSSNDAYIDTSEATPTAPSTEAPLEDALPLSQPPLEEVQTSSEPEGKGKAGQGEVDSAVGGEDKVSERGKEGASDLKESVSGGEKAQNGTDSDVILESRSHDRSSEQSVSDQAMLKEEKDAPSPSKHEDSSASSKDSQSKDEVQNNIDSDGIKKSMEEKIKEGSGTSQDEEGLASAEVDGAGERVNEQIKPLHDESEREFEIECNREQTTVTEDGDDKEQEEKSCGGEKIESKEVKLEEKEGTDTEERVVESDKRTCEAEGCHELNEGLKEVEKTDKDGEAQKEGQEKKEVEGDVEETEKAKEEEEEEDDQVLTFEEFKKKLMEQSGGQAVQKPPDQGGNGHSSGKKTTLTNYASVDCGAKVVEANPEAQNTMAILHENMDMYMINPCKANISFVVELCEVVSVRTIEIACFELFSSIPKTFKVSTSDSLSDGEWVAQGEFQISNERIIHSIPLIPLESEEHVYAKFIKVEMLSHYGQEHYCPLSLLRVLGASMMEVYEESRHNPRPPAPPTPHTPPVTLPPSEGFGQDDLLNGDKETHGEDNGTLLGAAKDVVMSVLNRPLSLIKNGLMKKDSQSDSGDFSSGPDTLTPPQETNEKDDRRETSQGQNVEDKDGSDPVAATDGDYKSSHPAEDLHANTDTSGPSNTEGRLDHLSEDIPDSSARLSSASFSDSQNTAAPIDSVVGLPATGGVALGPPGHSISPTPHTSFIAHPATEFVHPTPGSSIDHVPEPESASLGPDLGPDIFELSTEGDTSSSKPDLGESREAKDVNGGNSGATNGVSGNEVSTESKNSDSEENKNNFKSHIRMEQSELPASGNKDSHPSSDVTEADKTSANSSPRSDAVDATPTSIDTSSHSSATSSGSGVDNKEPDVTVVSHSATLDPTLSPSLSLASTSPSNSMTSKSTSGPDENSDLNDSTLKDVDTLSSSTPDSKSETEKHHNLDSHSSDTTCSDSTCHMNHSNVSDNGNPNISKSHSEDFINTTDSSTSLHSQNETFIQNGTQGEEILNITRNGNQTSNNSSSEHRSLPLSSQQKERSVFLRLSNHMEELESNMTVFSIFLDQISSSLKKNKNKTDESSKMLERRITAINASLAALQEQLESREGSMSEVKEKILEVAEVMRHTVLLCSNQRTEYVFLAELVIVLLIILTLLIITLLLWQCRALRTLSVQVQLLKTSQHSSQQPKPVVKRVELVGGLPTPDHHYESSHSLPSLPSLTSSCKSSSDTFSRSSSVSRLADMTASGVSSRTGVAKGVGGYGRRASDHTPHSFNSVYLSMQQQLESETSKEQDWLLLTDKKRRKFKPAKKT